MKFVEALVGRQAFLATHFCSGRTVTGTVEVYRFTDLGFGSTLLPSSSGPIEFFFTLHWEEKKKRVEFRYAVNL